MTGWSLFFLLLLLLVVFSAFGWLLFTQLRARRSGLPPPTWRSYLPFVNSDGANGGSSFPSSPHHSIIAWIKHKLHTIRAGRNRTAAGHYEGAGRSSGGEGGPTAYGGPGGDGGLNPSRSRGMDPDEAWDSQVGNEADPYGATAGPAGSFGDHEIGLAPIPGRRKDPYGGAVMPEHGDEPNLRGRSGGRNVPDAMGGQRGLDGWYNHEMDPTGSQNPFSDAHKVPSLRGVSPRPTVDASVGQGVNRQGGGGDHDDSPTEKKSVFREGL